MCAGLDALLLGSIWDGPDGEAQHTQEAAMASCVRHRVLGALPFREACVFCTAGV
ncbi:hypothetical protein ACIQM3_13650 [Streptomyces sp. NPDC091271]|uniref:hypothetical protein n=1 Tax=Streptomyces sp. NPDC091271 TaxID=3365980 RepID=UPI0038003756